TVVFAVKEIGESGAAIRRIAITAVVAMFAFLRHGALTQSDLPFRRSHFDDAKLGDLTHRKSVFRLVLRVGVFEFGHVAEAFNPFLDFDKHSEWCVPYHLALNRSSHRMRSKELFPNVRLKLFDS